MADLPHATPPVPEAVGTEGAEAIAPGREGEPDAARLGRFVVPCQLCPCPDRIGVGACVPPAGQAGAGGELVPRVAGEREMARTVEVAEGRALRWPPMVPEILWRAGTGAGEAAAPAVGDLRRKDRSLYVAHARGDRSRIVPVSESLAAGLGADQIGRASCRERV